ncbi:hypothetical protein DLAC_00866 [Tieghemostelium lacteum]|uniref:Uncharacterized protein n=1 Tax=Tieghemostelium lacteum TaxID=361077 RepID=A0A152A7P1_TIELA|nr:hypothetical protein DLAC_00866 [Tieghemostelium lacteum]|eukprot:KYR02067.1 hypothetical protein DLAC_00866 [Tieghemostelium lacteum]
MGKWTEINYENELIIKIKSMFDEINERQDEGTKQYSFEEFVENLDPKNSNSLQYFELLTRETMNKNTNSGRNSLNNGNSVRGQPYPSIIRSPFILFNNTTASSQQQQQEQQQQQQQNTQQQQQLSASTSSLIQHQQIQNLHQQIQHQIQQLNQHQQQQLQHIQVMSPTTPPTPHRVYITTNLHQRDQNNQSPILNSITTPPTRITWRAPITSSSPPILNITSSSSVHDNVELSPQETSEENTTILHSPRQSNNTNNTNTNTNGSGGDIHLISSSGIVQPPPLGSLSYSPTSSSNSGGGTVINHPPTSRTSRYIYAFPNLGGITHSPNSLQSTSSPTQR